MRRDCNPLWIDGKAKPLKQVQFNKKEFSENFLQENLNKYPLLLPVEEFDSNFGPIISLGMEIDNIDNLFIAPSGKLTIVETKLWRNHQATREVVAQILDYATRVSSWSYTELIEKCKRIKEPVLKVDQSLYELMRKKYPAETPSEAEFIDLVQKSLNTGRFLLLIVGDGIREGLSTLLDALHTHPKLLFTFGMVELQVFNDPEGSHKHLIVPHIVANSTEIVRAVVRVEGSGRSEINVEIEAAKSDDIAPTKRRTLSEDEFYEMLPNSSVSTTVRKLLKYSKDFGAIIKPQGKSISVKLIDPNGSRQLLTLFLVTTTGEFYTGWLSGQLRTIGLSKKIAKEWVNSIVNLIPGVQPHPKYSDSLSRNVKMNEIEKIFDEFLECLRETIAKIQSIETK
jgi:hypothetical protein